MSLRSWTASPSHLVMPSVIQGKVSNKAAASASMKDIALSEFTAIPSHCVIPSASQGIVSIAARPPGVGVAVGVLSEVGRRSGVCRLAWAVRGG